MEGLTKMHDNIRKIIDRTGTMNLESTELIISPTINQSGNTASEVKLTIIDSQDRVIVYSGHSDDYGNIDVTHNTSLDAISAELFSKFVKYSPTIFADKPMQFLLTMMGITANDVVEFKIKSDWVFLELRDGGECLGIRIGSSGHISFYDLENIYNNKPPRNMGLPKFARQHNSSTGRMKNKILDAVRKYLSYIN